MFRLYLTMLLTVEVAGIALLALLVPGSPARLLAAVPLITLIVALVGRRATLSPSYRLRRLSPEGITGFRPPNPAGNPAGATPEDLSRSIIERALEIRRTLEQYPSEVRIEMCALGYRTCVNDMITLTHLANEELENANFLRRVRLNRARKKATEALAAARQALPPGALRATHQEL